MDKFFNEENLAKQLTQHNCVVVTNKEIDLNLIQNLKSNIHSIVYFIETKDNPDFIKSIQSMGINYICVEMYGGGVKCPQGSPVAS